jgi:hypothetical protein
VLRRTAIGGPTVQVFVDGEYSSVEVVGTFPSVIEYLTQPPVTRTRPSGRTVEVCRPRGVTMDAAGLQVVDTSLSALAMAGVGCMNDPHIKATSARRSMTGRTPPMTWNVGMYVFATIAPVPFTREQPSAPVCAGDLWDHLSLIDGALHADIPHSDDAASPDTPTD